MRKREFIKTGTLVMLGTIATPMVLGACKTNQKITGEAVPAEVSKPLFYEVPALEYPFNALEPHIDALTMEIHHDKHHAAYVKNLNKALEGHDWASKELNVIFENLKNVEKDNAIRNNGGGHFNHSLFWKTIGPNAGGQPLGNLADKINSTFGSFENFKNKFIESAAGVFGSGWTWLCSDSEKNLFICNTANQDNPLMKNIVPKTGTPLLGLDVWEHAYYLKYQNKRKDYLNAFFNVIRWDVVGVNYK
jgi:Fe-Mn family superoxide dismutase